MTNTSQLKAYQERLYPQAWWSQGFLALATKVIEDHGDGDGVPEQFVVDEDGVDEVEGEEPEEKSRDPAGKLGRTLSFT